MAKAKTTNDDAPIALPPINLQTVKLHVVGDTSLITHAWSERSIKGIQDKQSKKAKGAREARDPEREYEDSIYRTHDGKSAMVGAAFKKAAVEACRLVPDMAMTEARILFHVLDEMVALKGEPQMRTDMRRLESGTWDPVYRAEYLRWECDITVRYNAGTLSLEQVVNLFNLAGLCGVGDWRPSSPKGKSGNHGMFHIE
jgi:hypothetical protein